MMARKKSKAEYGTLRLVKMQEDEELIPTPTEKEGPPRKRPGSIVQQMTSFADDLDRMIDDIMKM